VFFSFPKLDEVLQSAVGNVLSMRLAGRPMSVLLGRMATDMAGRERAGGRVGVRVSVGKR